MKSYFFQCHGHNDVSKTSEKNDDKSESTLELQDRECCFSSVTKPLFIRDLPELEPKQATEIKISKKVKDDKKYREALLFYFLNISSVLSNIYRFK